MEVSDAVDPKVKNTLCFGIYRFEDATLNENILMSQTDVCSDVSCTITFDSSVANIFSPALGASSTVTLATSLSTIRSTGLLCDYAWTVSTFAKYANGSLVPNGYVTTVDKIFSDPDYGDTLT